eukprot:TRINITY_DN5404_c0_g1_i3.p1 TRINITY_DN5404_c0_g1~~TRINITY_DN5404_c0_g1_i3.p1  ORF type:complete len:158 (+),score=29.47 TRINITY_DN5404_c0_g1_i3:124-597(+)
MQRGLVGSEMCIRDRYMGSHVQLINYGNRLYVIYEKKYGEPLKLGFSPDGGKSWKMDIPFLDKSASEITLVKTCDSSSCRFLIFERCNYHSACLWEMDPDSFALKELKTPYHNLYGTLSELTIAVARTSNGKDLAVALTNIHSEDHYSFVISKDSQL